MMKMLLPALVIPLLSGCLLAPSGVRVSERFGYDPVDSTRFLQAALDSGEKTLILDRQKGDWFVRPLRVTGRTDLTILFEDGVRVVAKRGAFKDPYVAMLTFDRCTNIVIRGTSRNRCGFRMWHDDYYTRDKFKPNAKGYRWSEWRHGLSFLTCANVTLENISSNESGGDGLYISTSGRKNATPGSGSACVNFTVRNCLFDRNNRQGISVIAVRGLLVEDTILSNTFGTAPAAGIDFEPNAAHEALTDIVMRRCQSVNNEGNGFEFYLNQHDKTSEPLRALFEDCVAISNKFNFAYSGGQETTRPDEAVDYGHIVIKGCRFAESRENGLTFWHRPYSKGLLEVRDTVLENNCTAYPERADINVTVSAHGVHEPDVYSFENVKVIRKAPGRVINTAPRKRPCNGKPSVFRGAISSVVAGKAETLTFDEKWNAEMFPYRAATDAGVARVAAPLDKVEIVDTCPDKMVEIAHPIFFRGPSKSAVFYADRAKEVHFKLLQTLVGKRDYTAPYQPVRVHRLGEKLPLDPDGVRMPLEPDGAVVAFKVPEKGFYRLALVTGGNGVAILATDVPVAYDATDEYVNFIAPCGGRVGPYRKAKAELCAYVPAGTDFSFLHVGSTTEMVGVEVVDPAGKVVRHEDALADLNALTFRQAAGGFWKLRAFAPSEGVFEDFNFSLAGVPGWLFLTPEKYWR